MKPSILHVSYADRWGGSAASARRLHENLRAAGHVSRMLVHRRDGDDPDVSALVPPGGLRAKAETLGREIGARLGWPEAFLPSRIGLARDPRLAACDVVQLYNVHGGWFDLSVLPALSARAPVVWRLSDMWAATGHCAYSGGCARWRAGCGACPDLAAYPPLPRDTTAAHWARKRDIYARSDVTIVAPASWSERIARESPLLSRFDVRRIPNGVDTARFSPGKRMAGRARWGFDEGNIVVLFGAHIAGEARKGGATLIEALSRLGATPALRVLALGAGGAQLAERLAVPVRATGYLSDPEDVALATAASDVAALPSAEDNLPNSALEAMAAGRAIVASDAGGMRDAIRDAETGFLIPPGDAEALAAAISRLARDADLRARLGEAARTAAVAEFDAALEVSRFARLYDERLAARQ
ncbi:MAG: glycosyltransferase [Tagaea sp.]|nr:glycosyltransferase [Tagaea sp.]